MLWETIAGGNQDLSQDHAVGTEKKKAHDPGIYMT